MTNFESLRHLILAAMPQQLEAFDRLALRLRNFQHDDDLILFIEAAGFVALLSHQVPQAILESNETSRQTLASLKTTLEKVAESKDELEQAQMRAGQTARELEATCQKISSAALDAVTQLDTKALSEKLSIALLHSIEQSVLARSEIAASAQTLKEVSVQYREEVRQFNRIRILRVVLLAGGGAFLLFGAIYFVVWEEYRHSLDEHNRQQLADSLAAARELEDRGVTLNVVRDRDTIYLIIPDAGKAYLSNRGEGVIAIPRP